MCALRLRGVGGGWTPRFGVMRPECIPWCRMFYCFCFEIFCGDSGVDCNVFNLCRICESLDGVYRCSVRQGWVGGREKEPVASEPLRTAAAAESCVYPVLGVMGIGRHFFF